MSLIIAQRYDLQGKKYQSGSGTDPRVKNFMSLYILFVFEFPFIAKISDNSGDKEVIQLTPNK